MNELISVIMSSYNEELEWVEKSIESILNQSYKNIEFIIVMDNPENKKLDELLLKYQQKDNRIKLIKNDVNIGLVKSLNKALKHCQGKYVARMDADDISISNRLATQKKYLEQNNLDFVFSGMIVIDEEGNKTYEMDTYELDVNEIKKKLKYTNISTHPTWLLKTEIYKKLKGYRDIPYCEDYDFTLRAINNNFKIGKTKENLLMYRIRNNSISKSYVLEQFMISRKIVSLYKKNKLDDYSELSIKISKWKNGKVNEDEKRKYIQAEDTFKEGVKLIKVRNYLKGLIKLLQSIFISKYYIFKTINIFRYKISKIF